MYAAKRLIGRRFDSAGGAALRSTSAPTRSCAVRTTIPRIKIGEQDVHVPRDLRHHPARDEARRRGIPRGAGDRGRRHHRAGLLQRYPAPEHEGRRQDRGPRGAAHHQRADRGGARLWHGVASPTRRSRCTTSVAVRSTSRSSRCPMASIEVLARPRAIPSSAVRTSIAASSPISSTWFQQTEGIDLRSDNDGAAAAEGRGREGQVRSLDPRVQTRSTCRSSRATPTGPRHLELRADARDARERWCNDMVSARSRASSNACRTPASRPPDIDQIVLVGWPDPHAAGAERGHRVLRQAPAQGREPGRGRRARRGDSGSALVEEEGQNVLLLDVTPLSLGIGTFGGHFARLIDRNTTVPVSKAHIFTTTRDDQSAVKIRVLQGERVTSPIEERSARRVRALRRCRPAPKGEPEIEVCVRHRRERHRQRLRRAISRRARSSPSPSTRRAPSPMRRSSQIIEENELYEVQLKG